MDRLSTLGSTTIEPENPDGVIVADVLESMFDRYVSILHVIALFEISSPLPSTAIVSVICPTEASRGLWEISNPNNQTRRFL